MSSLNQNIAQMRAYKSSSTSHKHNGHPVISSLLGSSCEANSSLNLAKLDEATRRFRIGTSVLMIILAHCQRSRIPDDCKRHFGDHLRSTPMLRPSDMIGRLKVGGYSLQLPLPGFQTLPSDGASCWQSLLTSQAAVDRWFDSFSTSLRSISSGINRAFSISSNTRTRSLPVR